MLLLSVAVCTDEQGRVGYLRAMPQASGARRPLGCRREDGSPPGPRHAVAWYTTAVPAGARNELSVTDLTSRVAFICSDRGLIRNAQSKVLLLLRQFNVTQ